MAHWKALSEGFPMVPGAGSVSVWFSYRDRLSVGLVWPERLGSVSMHCEWARMPVVFRLSGRPGSERPFVWGADVSGVQALVGLPVQHWFLSAERRQGLRPCLRL
eukprot:scaffold25606_cov110-Isochrysis_galbana.AAC.1